MTRLPDPQALALKILLHARARYVHGTAPFAMLQNALGSADNVWQVIHRLRQAGHKIRTHKCPRGDRSRGGYQLLRLADDRLGFNVLEPPGAERCRRPHGLSEAWKKQFAQAEGAGAWLDPSVTPAGAAETAPPAPHSDRESDGAA